MAKHCDMSESQEDRLANEKLVQWATQRGVVCDGVRPVNLSGRGRGMVAQRKLNQGEQIIHVPAATLLAVDSDTLFLKKHAQQISKCSIHGRVAANLLCALVKQDHPLRAWASIMPSLNDLKECMPIFWPPELQKCLPDSTLSILKKQQEKLFADLNALLEEYLPVIAEETQRNVEDLKEIYMRSWMLVNSRCFYWDYEYPMPTLKGGEQWPANWKRPKARIRTNGRPRDDCMALSPVIDCFNHSVDQNCAVTFDARGFFVTCVHDCEPGEELYVAYGSHSNDYLLAEYGFLLDQNKNDHTTLDAAILPRLSSSQKQQLEAENMLGTYTLDSSGICHRTQCALRILLLPFRKWKRFVSGADDGAGEQANVNTLLRTILTGCIEESESKTRLVRELVFNGEVSDVSFEEARVAVEKRLRQVNEVLDGTLRRL